MNASEILARNHVAIDTDCSTMGSKWDSHYGIGELKQGSPTAPLPVDMDAGPRARLSVGIRA